MGVSLRYKHGLCVQHRRNQTQNRHRGWCCRGYFPDWWPPHPCGGSREGVVNRHNGLTELDLTVTYRWTWS